MKLLRILPLVVGSAVAGILAITSPAHALTTWSFNNATFSDGARLTGSFNYDETNTNYNTSAAYSGVNITLYNNLNAILATYATANISASSTADKLYLNSGGYGLFVYNMPSAWYNVTGTNSTINFSNGNTSYGLGTAPGFSVIANGSSGSVTAAAASVPFDIPGGATIPTVGSLLALGAMRKVKKSIASKTSIASPVWETVK